jgi:hypothetical protein
MHSLLPDPILCIGLQRFGTLLFKMRRFYWGKKTNLNIREIEGSHSQYDRLFLLKYYFIVLHLKI